MSEKHVSKPASWVTVGVLVLGFVLLGLALPMKSLALGITAAVILVVGFVMVFAFKVMEDFH